jgi:hypothetical protein
VIPPFPANRPRHRSRLAVSLNELSSPQKSREVRSDELIAGWKAFNQTLRVVSRARFRINQLKQTV